MTKEISFGILILLSFGSKSAVSEERGRGFEYWDAFTTGILHLVDDQPEAAIQEFRKAGNHLLGEAELENKLQRISKTMSQDGAPASAIECLKHCSGEPKIFSRYFLAKALSDARKEDNRTKVQLLTQALALPLDEAPWNMSDELIRSLRLRRAQLAEKIGGVTKQEIELALNDYRSLKDWNPATAIHETPGVWLIKSANAAYQHKECSNASRLYLEYRKAYPYSPAGDLVMLNQGKCLVMMKDYASAYPLFKQKILEFPASKHVRKAQKYGNYV